MHLYDLNEQEMISRVLITVPEAVWKRDSSAPAETNASAHPRQP
jgi:hypothetical protein